MREIWSLARRELAGFFNTSIAYIFIGAFLAVSLFVVFWVDTFFARNLADVRPLFQWMPLLLIFLVAAITMRMWSEERRAGTLEALMTSPVAVVQLVLGKFLACFILITIALLLTLGLPITVAMIGPLDWGPVIGGYVAALLLACTYIAVGLYISARTKNQIVALIGSVIVGIVLYLPGSHLLGAFFSAPVSHWLSLIGTGSRFDSITRGVLDLRDLYYYVSLALAFLVLNGLALARLRWGPGRSRRHRLMVWTVVALIANLLAANVWLDALTSARIDLTQNKRYTLSQATHSELTHLSEPLRIEGFFSSKTQPLLAPLVPQLKNLIREYAIAGGRHVTVSFADPQSQSGLAQRIAKRYGIKPVPFRNRSRYEASVVNAYFDVLVKYGDQYKVLNFQNLIGVGQSADGKLKVNLKAPEYALTSTIKQVVSDYQKKGNVFASLTSAVTLKGFISSNQVLPAALHKLRASLTTTLAGLKKQSDGRFKVDIKDPSANKALAKKIAQQYGFQPMVAGLLNPQPFYFYLLLKSGSQTVPVALPKNLSGDGLKKAIETGLDQFASGMRKTVAVFAPKTNPMMARMGRASGPQFSHLLKALRRHAIVKQTQLTSGQVPAGTQLLLVLAPDNVSNKQLFAIDQFLMTGGTVVMATSPYQVSMGQAGLSAKRHKTGLAKWLAAKGIHIKPTLVMDTQNATFPVPVYRHLGGMTLREYYPMPYPYFPFVAGKGLSASSPVTHHLGQVTMSWASPLTLDHKALAADKVVKLLRSSAASWLSKSTQIAPKRGANGHPLSWQPKGKQASRLLGVAVSGRFSSWFKGRKNPLLHDASKPSKTSKKPAKGSDKTPLRVTSIIDHSPAASRLVVLSSASFADDRTLGMIGAGLGRQYNQPVKLLQNLVDFSLESPATLALRAKSSTSRLLKPLNPGQQEFWEYLNYALALLGLLITALIAWLRRKRHRARLSDWLTRQGV